MSVLCLRDQRGTPLLVRCRELLGVEDVIYRERSTVLCRSRTLAVAKIRSNFLLLLVDIVLDSPQFSRVLLLVRDQGLDAETPVRLHRGFAFGSFARVGMRSPCGSSAGRGWMLLLLSEYTRHV